MSRRTSVLMETHLSSWKHTLLLKEKLHFTKLPLSFNVFLNHTQYTYLLFIYTYIYFHSWDFPIMSCLLCSNISLHLSYTIIVTIIYTKDWGKSRWHRHTMYWFIFQACMNPTNLGDGALASPCHGARWFQARVPVSLNSLSFLKLSHNWNFRSGSGFLCCIFVAFVCLGYPGFENVGRLHIEFYRVIVG